MSEPAPATDPILKAARAFLLLGIGVLPVDAEKRPLFAWKELQNRFPSEEELAAWWPSGHKLNVAVLTGPISGGLAVLDIDDVALAERMAADVALVSQTTAIRTPRGGLHLWAIETNGASENGASPSGPLVPGVADLKARGGYVLVPPSRTPAGAYVALSKVLPVKVDNARRWALALLREYNVSGAADGGTAPAAPLPDRIVAGHRNDVLTSLAGTMRRRGATAEAIEAALAVENDTRCEPPLSPSEVRQIARSVGRYPAPPPTESTDSPLAVSSDVPRFHRTDAGNGELFAHLYGDRVRFDHRRHRWLLWRDHWWLPDADAELERMAKEAARRRYHQAPALFADETERGREAHWAISSESRMRLEAALALASSERPITDAGADWDSAPWLLGVANGVVDLRSGELRAGRPEDRLTMHSPVAYDPDAPYLNWLAFLDRIMAGNEALIDFLQRAVGYSLTGDVSEQVLFFLYGTGANGKSTFLGALLDTLGDYGRQAAPGLLLAKRGERHPTEYADLEGARFVSSVEVDEGRRLAEGLVKWLTGGDRMKARKMRQDFYEFRPTYKIWLAANHKPTITGTDLAIWRRIRLVPFNVVIPAEEQDPCLPGKLRGELPGILAWAVEGCQGWQRDGLGTPQEVVAATERYRAEQDILAGFLEDCCVIDPSESVTSNALYVAYTNWCKTSGEKQLTKTALGLRLGERGFTPGRVYTEGRLWQGLGLSMTRSGGESDTP